MSDHTMEVNFFQECWERFKRPWCNSFSAYFIFIIVLISAGGVIFSIFSSNNEDRIFSVASNMSTYFMALIIPAVIDIFLSFGKLRNKVSFSIFTVVILVFSIFLLWLSNSLEKNYVLFPAILGVLFSWFFWVIANSDNENLNDYSYDKKIKEEVAKNHGGNWDEK
jgi:hypothetical protein